MYTLFAVNASRSIPGVGQVVGGVRFLTCRIVCVCFFYLLALALVYRCALVLRSVLCFFGLARHGSFVLFLYSFRFSFCFLTVGEGSLCVDLVQRDFPFSNECDVGFISVSSRERWLCFEMYTPRSGICRIFCLSSLCLVLVVRFYFPSVLGGCWV